jgi:hypothetical protein
MSVFSHTSLAKIAVMTLLITVGPLFPIRAAISCRTDRTPQNIASTQLVQTNSIMTELVSRPFSNTFQPQLYRLIAPRSAEALGPWAPKFPNYSEVVGYSSLGHFFLRDPKSQEYIVLHPFKAAAKSYGEFSTVEDFERDVLKEPGFEAYVLLPDHVAEIARKLGPLKEDEIYIPTPYPFLGGSETPKTYHKGNVWVFADIVAQFLMERARDRSRR